MKLFDRTKLLFSFLIVGFLASCGGDNSTGSEPEIEEPVVAIGTLEVAVTTEGDSHDEDGYTITLNGSKQKSAKTSETVSFPELEEGFYEVELSGVAQNCRIEGENPQQAFILVDKTKTVQFSVSCTLALKDKIVYVRDSGRSEKRIMIMNSDGSQVRELIQDSFAYTPFPKISPDGTKIAFTQRNLYEFHLFVMNADGSDLHIIDTNQGIAALNWTFDGSKILYGASNGDEFNFNLVQYDLESGIKRNLTSNEWADYLPAVSPDGSQIAFVSDRTGDSKIHLYNTGHGGTGRLTTSAAGISESSPAWSPDGSRILFVSDKDGDDELYMSEYPDRNIIQLTKNSANDISPAWSSDGSEIIFVSDRDSTSQIYKMKLGENTVIQLTNSGNNYTPSWSQAN